jgi:hypothetical protein
MFYLDVAHANQSTLGADCGYGVHTFYRSIGTCELVGSLIL